MSASRLDADQCLQHAFDDATGRFKVDAEVSATIVSAAQEVVISHVDDSIKIGDGTDFLAVQADGSINVNVSSATVSNGSGASAVNIQDGGNSITVDGAVSVSNFPATQPISGSVSVSNFPATQAVSIASMPSTPVTGTFWQATQPVSGTFFQATQPVSGTVTANLGTIGAAATETTLSALDSKHAYSTSTITAVAGSTSSQTAKSANANRKSLKLYNDSNSVCYITEGATSSSSAFTFKLVSDAYYEYQFPIYTGTISVVWVSATGNLMVTEGT